MVYLKGEEEKKGITTSQCYPSNFDPYVALMTCMRRVYKPNMGSWNPISIPQKSNLLSTCIEGNISIYIALKQFPHPQTLSAVGHYAKKHFFKQKDLSQSPFSPNLKRFSEQLPKKEIERLGHISRTRHRMQNFIRRFWSVVMPSLMSESVVLILQHSIERGPFYWKYQQKTGCFNRISVDSNQTNTSRIASFAKKMDTESCSQIEGKKFQTRFCGQLFSHLLQNRAIFLFQKQVPTLRKDMGWAMEWNGMGVLILNVSF